MIEWKSQPLYFAVIDGDNPKAWKPWESEAQDFGTLIENCQDMISKRPIKENEPKALFKPLAEPLAEILDSERLHGVVGAIIDGKDKPEDLEFRERQMEALEQLCTTMRHSSDLEKLMIKQSVDWFEIWFFIEGDDLDKWSQWATRANDIVRRCFDERPRIEYIWSGALFPQQARRFLTDSRYSMLWGKR